MGTAANDGADAAMKLDADVNCTMLLKITSNSYR